MGRFELYLGSASNYNECTHQFKVRWKHVHDLFMQDTYDSNVEFSEMYKMSR